MAKKYINHILYDIGIITRKQTTFKFTRHEMSEDAKCQYKNTLKDKCKLCGL